MVLSRIQENLARPFTIMDNKTFLLAANHIPNLGPRTIKVLQQQWPNLSTLFKAPLSVLQESGLSLPLCQAILHFDWHKVEADLAWEQHAGHHIFTIEDPKYPALLKEIYDPPTVLYLKGNLGALDNPCIALVGTRKPSCTGRDTAYQFAQTLAKHSLSLVSGLALGIDAAIHEGCLKVLGQTIAVMGTGIDRVYPAKHQILAEKITEQGLLISEFPLKTPPASGHFPQRNRIISGLSLVTVVVEAAIKSGSLITARFALEQNRDVFAVPGSIYNPEARGCHHLLQQGATLVSSAEEILQELGLEVKKTQTSMRQKLASNNKNLVECIGFETTTVDTLCLRSGLTIDQVTCSLAELEMQGLIKTVTGGYIRCSE